MEAHFSLLVIEALLESKLTNRLYHFIIFATKKFYTIILSLHLHQAVQKSTPDNSNNNNNNNNNNDNALFI